MCWTYHIVFSHHWPRVQLHKVRRKLLPQNWCGSHHSRDTLFGHQSDTFPLGRGLKYFELASLGNFGQKYIAFIMIIFFKTILIIQLLIQIVWEFLMTEKKHRALKYSLTSNPGHSETVNRTKNLNFRWSDI